MNITEIVSYYTHSQLLYRLFGYSPQTLGMHFGFWKKGITNLDDAINEQNRMTAEWGNINSKSRVLDAGCGVGGTAMYIAQNYKASIDAISITPSQIELAKKYAGKKGLSDKIIFSVCDYSKMNFPDEYFDIVYGVESVCYAHPKSVFLKEAYRILKPGGLLVVSDGYMLRQSKNEREKEIAGNFCKGFALEKFYSVSEFEKEVKKAGFKIVRKQNMTREIMPSIERYHTLTKRWGPLVKFLRGANIPITTALWHNYLAMTSAIEGVQKGLFGYYIHLMKKR